LRSKVVGNLGIGWNTSLSREKKQKKWGVGNNNDTRLKEGGMDYLRQIDDDLRALAVETKQRYPEIHDAIGRALDTSKVMRDHYISDIRRSNEKDAALSRSSDVSAPYILLCNYADASSK